MNVIRKMQEERKEWEAEKAQIEENNEWYEKELARLQAENAKLLSNPAGPAAAPVVLSAPVQAHHEQQIKLMETIDALKRDLQSERDRREQLERVCNSSQPTGGASPAGGGLGQLGQLDMTLASAMRPMPASEDFESLEDENLKLREELNASKEKVIELKRAAGKRSSEWRSELNTITEELATKQQLDEEAAGLRRERSRLQEELTQTRELLGQRESIARSEIDRLKEDLQRMQKNARSSQAEELDKLSQTMGQRVIELEEELSDKVGKHSHLLTLFFKHAERPLEALRIHCKRLVASSMPNVEFPNSFVADPSNVQQSLVNIIEMLRWAEEVAEGYEESRKKGRSGYGR